MQWLSDLIKHVTISRPLTAAVFVTSGVLIAGHKLFPDSIDSVPTQWRWLLLASFISTLSLLVLWYVPLIFHASTAGIQCMLHHPRIDKPTVMEIALINILAEAADDGLNLRTVRRIEDVCVRGIISTDDVYEWFSDYIIDTYENKEIKAYITKLQKEDSDYYHSFVELYNRVHQYMRIKEKNKQKT
jgi:succinate dehydrogenase flavin-adding protein (antitoxin of CptAB toxin-antitoxin module)